MAIFVHCLVLKSVCVSATSFIFQDHQACFQPITSLWSFWQTRNNHFLLTTELQANSFFLCASKSVEVCGFSSSHVVGHFLNCVSAWGMKKGTVCLIYISKANETARGQTWFHLLAMYCECISVCIWGECSVFVNMEPFWPFFGGVKRTPQLFSISTFSPQDPQVQKP